MFWSLYTPHTNEKGVKVKRLSYIKFRIQWDGERFWEQMKKKMRHIYFIITSYSTCPETFWGVQASGKANRLDWSLNSFIDTFVAKSHTCVPFVIFQTREAIFYGLTRLASQFLLHQWNQGSSLLSWKLLFARKLALVTFKEKSSAHLLENKNFQLSSLEGFHPFLFPILNQLALT